ncbi:hypothetical protein BN1708_018419, partial [Verticillium longisporum]
PSRGSERARA